MAFVPCNGLHNPVAKPGREIWSKNLFLSIQSCSQASAHFSESLTYSSQIAWSLSMIGAWPFFGLSMVPLAPNQSPLLLKIESRIPYRWIRENRNDSREPDNSKFCSESLISEKFLNASLLRLKRRKNGRGDYVVMSFKWTHSLCHYVNKNYKYSAQCEGLVQSGSSELHCRQSIL